MYIHQLCTDRYSSYSSCFGVFMLVTVTSLVFLLSVGRTPRQRCTLRKGSAVATLGIYDNGFFNPSLSPGRKPVELHGELRPGPVCVLTASSPAKLGSYWLPLPQGSNSGSTPWMPTGDSLAWWLARNHTYFLWGASWYNNMYMDRYH